MSAPVRLAVIGAGPSATYVMERLAATADSLGEGTSLEIHVYDRSGHFGDGEVHSAEQPTTSFLNRIVGQVAFAADESVSDAGPLLPRDLRPTLHEWCRTKFDETGDPSFDLSPEDWPKRYVHGLALREQFETYLGLLRAHPRIEVLLHGTEVIDLVEQADGLRPVTADGAIQGVVDHVLMLTGHSANDPASLPRQSAWAEFAANGPATFVSSVYPLEVGLPESVVAPGRSIGCAGMGLTAIDVVLHLTEGRGGAYDEVDGRLVYRPSGREPASILAFSGSGLFTFARPFNAKERDLANLEHRGVFLTEGAVDRLRAAVGSSVLIGDRMRRQLDFERHILPIVLLEMALLQHTTLLGVDAGRALGDAARPTFEAFLHDAGGDVDSDRAQRVLLRPLEEAFTGMATVLDGVLRGERSIAAAEPWVSPALRRFLHVVYGEATAAELAALLDDQASFAAAVAAAKSPWGNETTVAGNAFSWKDTIEPVDGTVGEDDFREALLAFMRLDHLRADQNNIDNPVKAAADGVWRDLRPVLAHAVDFGGLTAQSHKTFLDVYMRHHNRLANGAALEVMEKMLALVERGLLDVSIGPGASVRGVDGRWRVTGRDTGVERDFDVLVDARVHSFDPEADLSPIYPNLLRRGLVRKWRNPGQDGAPAFEPGGLDLTEGFHPVRTGGSADERLTFLGPPSEGVMFFQLGALRPNQDHHIMHDVLRWLHEFWGHVRTSDDLDAALVR